MPAGLGPDSCPRSGQPLSHLRAPWGLCSYVGAPGTLTETHYRAKREGRGPNRQDGKTSWGAGGREGRPLWTLTQESGLPFGT